MGAVDFEAAERALTVAPSVVGEDHGQGPEIFGSGGSAVVGSPPGSIFSPVERNADRARQRARLTLVDTTSPRQRWPPDDAVATSVVARASGPLAALLCCSHAKAAASVPGHRAQ